MGLLNYEEWRARHPVAAHELEELFATFGAPQTRAGTSETAISARARIDAAGAGAALWRNNVGAVPARCKSCGAESAPVRYGLCNDSAKLNAKFKSSDLIGVTPTLITTAHIGRTLGVFTAIETKREGWVYSGKGRESAQAAFLALVAQKGGLSFFYCGTGDLRDKLTV